MDTTAPPSENVTLAQAIHMVMPHATKERTLPNINCVRIDSDAVIATDRYTAAMVNVTTGIPDGHYMLIDLTTAKKGVAKIEPLETEKQTIVSGKHAMIVTAANLTFEDGSTIKYQALIGDFPDIRRLFNGFNPAAATGAPNSLAVDAAFWAKFDRRHFPKTGKGLHTMRFEFAENNTKPALVTFTDHPYYRALWVPIKISA